MSVGSSRPASSTGLRAVVSYKAFITSDLEQSSISLEPSIARPVLSSALALPPEWIKGPWRPPATNSDEALLDAALRKFLALFEFGAMIQGSTPAGIRAEIQSTLSVTLGVGVRAQMKRFVVDGKILEDGKPIWGYTIPKPGDWPSGFKPHWLPAAQATNLDLVLQNLVRADLQTRLAT
jgi:hypothetical protein